MHGNLPYCPASVHHNITMADDGRVLCWDCDTDIQTTRFRHLVAWCWMMGSHAYYVHDELARAIKAGAPDDVVSCPHPTHGRMIAFSEVTSTQTRETIARIMEDRFGVPA